MCAHVQDGAELHFYLIFQYYRAAVIYMWELTVSVTRDMAY